jgi:hypothetical protein
MLRGPASSTGEWNSTLGAAGFAPGAMTSSTTPNPFQPYFGEPIRELKLNPYAAYGRENWALPDAYQVRGLRPLGPPSRLLTATCREAFRT